MKEAALALARKGYAVFPLNPDKSPRTPNGFRDATIKFHEIEKFNWDGAWIGAAIPEWQFVVDVDPRNGGDQTLALFDSIPDTRMVKTGGGGMHYYFRVDPDLKLRNSLGPGVDIKRHGKGYVVVPPSPGYEFLNEDTPAMAPDWLLKELVVEERPEKESQPSDAKYFGWENGTAYGLKALAGEVGKLALAGEGGRNHALNAAAFAMGQLQAGGEIDYDYAYQALATEAHRIGLHPREITATLDSGFQAGTAEPRQAPEDEVVKRNPGSFEAFAITGGRVPDEKHMWLNWEQDEPDYPFYVYPLIPHNAYITVYGATEASKSMAWVGILAEASRHGIKSSVYSLENPGVTDRRRVRRLRPDPANFRITNEPLDFNDRLQLDALIAREKENQTNIILIDTYSHAFSGPGEDGNAKAIEFARRCRWVMAEVGCSVITIDHTGYMHVDEPRDASAKRQQVDVAILMKKIGPDWTGPGSPAMFQMINKKSSRFANPFEIEGEIRDTGKGGTGDLEIRWTTDTKPEFRGA